MTFTITNHSIRRVGAALGAGVLALGLSGAVAAHGANSGHGGGYRSGHAPVVVENHYYGRQHGKKHRGHGRRHHGKRHHGHGRQHRRQEVVHIHKHYRPPVEVVHVYEPQTRVIERVYEPQTRVIERVVPQRTHGGYAPAHGNSQLNAGSLVGAAIGGLIGSQIGGGRGQLAATAAGSVGGFLLGDHATRGYR